jgi:hypothetical protein
MSDPYVNLEDIYEPIVEAFKDTLLNMDKFDRVSEGEELYDLMTQEAWVVPGRDRIESGGMHMLRHYLDMNVIIFNSEAETASQPELRLLGEEAYNELMQDITHGGTCHWALPTLFHPGYVQIGGTTVVGVLMQFTCHFEQFYPLPS